MGGQVQLIPTMVFLILIILVMYGVARWISTSKFVCKGPVSLAKARLTGICFRAEGEAVACLLVMHAEDQLMSAEAFKLVAQELIDVYKEIDKK